ncbi:porin family protein [Flammeovirga sp. SubArs3]|uniref:porin family protein n=1 Tax=Flammeovirga sp. SubArs3 TaxID=2995316 RepID=UPI00248C7F4C|nr:porin family protein [Flammeovirga sp. SubArs3]
MKFIYLWVALFSVTFFTSSLQAQTNEEQNNEKSLVWGGRFSINFGASVPLYFQDIPKRYSWSTTFNPSVGAYVEIPLKEDRKSVHIELIYTRKGNSTEATVENRYFKVSDNYQGYVTGDVQTNISLNYIEIPIQFKTNLSKKDNGWYAIAGLYLAAMVSGTFDGILYAGGTLEDIVGSSTEIGRDTPYDYSSDLVNFDWGAQFGIQKEIGNHFTVDTQIAWGFNGIFPRGYDTVDPNLFNLYGKIGVLYKIGK